MRRAKLLSEIRSYVNQLEVFESNRFEGPIFLISYTTCGDYAGSLIEKANSEILEEYWPLDSGLIRVSELYSTEYLALTEEGRDRILQAVERAEAEAEADSEDTALLSWAETAAGLEDYPCADENAAAEAEAEAWGEAWESWAEREWYRQIESALGIDLPSNLRPEHRERLQAMFWEACSRSGTYPYNETANSMIIDWERLSLSEDETAEIRDWPEVTDSETGEPTRTPRFRRSHARAAGSFMQPEYVRIESPEDIGVDADADAWNGPGVYCRLSASGYHDCTDWCGPFPSLFRAARYLSDTYDCHPRSGATFQD